MAIEQGKKPEPIVMDSQAPEPLLPGSEIPMPAGANNGIVEPPAAVTVKPLSPMQSDNQIAQHVALLLPLNSAIFGSAAESVQQGFQAAASLEAHARTEGLPGALSVRVYACSDENTDIAALYRQAISDGASAVVGPLTRSGVGLLAAEPNLPVPTLALNVVESPLAGQLYFFGMAVEAEARQAALLANQENLHQAIVITTQTQLSKRLQLAFEEEWRNLGGTILREIEFNGDPALFADISAMPDTMAFLATDAETARLINPYLPNKLPVYGTSQLFTGNSDNLVNYDLDGVNFVDMPWLLQADHPAVMIYPHTSPPLAIDHERLYALGIDAFRLIQLMVAGKLDTALPLDGVTGQIQLRGHTFQRQSIPARFSQGRARLPGEPDLSDAPDDVPMFPQPEIHE